MPADRDALLEHYRQMREELLAAIDGLGDDLLSETSLDGWSVRDHLAHLAVWDDIRAAEVVRISAGYDSAWPLTADYQVHNDFLQPLMAGLSPAQVKWELDRSRQALLDAISAATPRGLDPSLYQEAGLFSRHEAQHTAWIKRWRTEKGV
jgi:hypothetical protein